MLMMGTVNVYYLCLCHNKVLTIFRHVESFQSVSCFLTFSSFQSYKYFCRAGSIGHPSSTPGTQAQPGSLQHINSAVAGDDTQGELISDLCRVSVSQRWGGW